MPKKLTELFVKNAQPRTQRAEFRDGHTRGLVLRVTPNGVKTWAVLYRRRSDARKRRYTIGSYPAFSLTDARNRAQEILAAVARGDDPARPEPGAAGGTKCPAAGGDLDQSPWTTEQTATRALR